MNNSTLGWRAQMALGATALTLATSCGAIDLFNNITFGLLISSAMAGLMFVAWLGVMGIPALAAFQGWAWHYLLILGLALSMTAWAGWDSYGTSQQTFSLASKERQDAHNKAEAKEKRAREVLTSIKETGTVEQLGTLAEKADKTEAEAGKKLADAETASAKVCDPEVLQPRACRAAKAEKGKAADASSQAKADAKLAHERLSQAAARDKAEADLAEAEQRSAKGGAVVHEENQILSLLGLALTLSGAMLGGEGIALIGAGMTARKAQTRAPKQRKETAPVPPTGGTRLPANVVPMRRHEVEAWLSSATEPGESLRGGEAIKAFNRWTDNAKMEPGELRSILAHIYGDALVARTSGYSVRGIQLRARTASQAKAVSC